VSKERKSYLIKKQKKTIELDPEDIIEPIYPNKDFKEFVVLFDKQL